MFNGDMNNIIEVLNYLNGELLKGRSQKDIEINDFKVNERVVAKRLNRAGYKKINNQYIKMDITSNNTPYKKHTGKAEEVYNSSDDVSILEDKQLVKMDINNNIDIDKLNLLLNNLDTLLELIPKRNITSKTGLKSGNNCVKSFRVDSGLYQAIKDRASRDNISIADILNKSLEDYLNNYL